MRNKIIGSTNNKKSKLLEQLLRENKQILFLPVGCAELQDSNFEPYLDCKVPEAAIFLSRGARELVGIGDGCKPVVLLESDGAELKFNPTFNKEIPLNVVLSLQHLFENLEGQPNRDCVVNFVEFLYRARPRKMEWVLRYFLENPSCWLIGLPSGSRSNRLFLQKPIHGGDALSSRWHQLSHLVVGEPLRIVV